MPIRLIRVARNLSLIGLVLGSLSASAADVGQGTADDQRPPRRSRPNPVHFADGSALPADEGPNTLTAVPTPRAGPGSQLRPTAAEAVSEPAPPPPRPRRPAG